MTIRFFLMISLSVALCAFPAHAQGRQPQQIVLSPSALKTLVAQKPKTKTSLNARLGVKRAPTSNVVTSPSANIKPTSVSQIKKTPAHR